MPTLDRPAPAVFTPAPVHRAIDHATAALLHTQRLRRAATGGGSATADLDRSERTLHELTALLRDLRDASMR